MAVNPQINPPHWWEWELAFTSHIESRMDERELSEVELRTMITDTTSLVPAKHPARYLANTRSRGQPWTVVLEPDPEDQLIYVVSAYPRD
jgi:hypothetical protein